MSRRESIIDAIVAALGAAGKPAGLTVHRMRTRPINKDTLPAAVVMLGPERIQRYDGGSGYHNRRAQTVRVELRVAVPTGTDPDTALDGLVTWAEVALMRDTSQGGLAVNTQLTSAEWDADNETDAHYAAAGLDFVVDYVTAAGNPDLP